jgi:hypothetical protein
MGTVVLHLIQLFSSVYRFDMCCISFSLVLVFLYDYVSDLSLSVVFVSSLHQFDVSLYSCVPPPLKV